MLVPLGVLALGAVFSGMVLYGSFFGDHDKVNAFFGIPTHAVEADAGHGDAAAADEGDAGHRRHAPRRRRRPCGATPPTPTMPPAPGTAPEGAIFMHPDNHVMDEAHHAPTWVKLSPFVAMLIGLATAYWFYIVNPSAAEAPGQQPAASLPLPAQQVVFRRDLRRPVRATRPRPSAGSCGNAATAT